MGVRFITIAERRNSDCGFKDCALLIHHLSRPQMSSGKTARLAESAIRNPNSAIASAVHGGGDDERDADDDRADDDGERCVLVVLDLLTYGEGRGLDDDHVGKAEDEQAEGREYGRRQEHAREVGQLHGERVRVERACGRFVEHHFPPWNPECQKWNER